MKLTIIIGIISNSKLQSIFFSFMTVLKLHSNMVSHSQLINIIKKIVLFVFFINNRIFVTINFPLKDVMMLMYHSIMFKMNLLYALPASIVLSPIMIQVIFNVFHNVILMKKSIIYLKTSIIV